MRFKYYLRGIGLGILFSVFIMAVSIHFHKDELVSDEDVINRASKMGMIMPESEEPETQNVTETESDSERPLDNIISGDEETSTEFVPATEGVTNESANTENPAGSEMTETTPDASLEDFSDKDYVIISIKQGDVPRDLCDKLKAYNIIEDSDDLRHYIGKKEGRILMVGDYKIPKDATYDDIIKIVFKK